MRECDSEECTPSPLSVRTSYVYVPLDPLLVVGAGLSAADAIVAALNQGVSTVHAFRKSPSDSSMIFKKLPSAIYPEYHR